MVKKLMTSSLTGIKKTKEINNTKSGARGLGVYIILSPKSAENSRETGALSDDGYRIRRLDGIG